MVTRRAGREDVSFFVYLAPSRERLTSLYFALRAGLQPFRFFPDKSASHCLFPLGCFLVPVKPILPPPCHRFPRCPAGSHPTISRLNSPPQR